MLVKPFHILSVFFLFIGVSIGALINPAPPPVVRLVEHGHVYPASFEGQGNATLGCSLWDNLYTHEKDDAERFGDFAIMGDNENGVFLRVVRGQDVAVATGERCGISVDWTRIPIAAGSGE